MIGAIAGDIIGSLYDGFGGRCIKTKDFDLFKDQSHYTDDTVLTCAVANALMNDMDFSKNILNYAFAYPGKGYGGNFDKWVKRGGGPAYNSWGNGSAMRVGSIALIASTYDQAIDLATKSAEVTHNHPEGIKGAQAVVACAYLAKTKSKEEIKEFINDNFYPMNFTIDEIRPTYKWHVSCQKSVPQAIMCFLESTDFEDAIRTVVSLGGDADTQGAMVGTISEVFYGVPQDIYDEVIMKLDEPLVRLIGYFYTWAMRKGFGK